MVYDVHVNLPVHFNRLPIVLKFEYTNNGNEIISRRGVPAEVEVGDDNILYCENELPFWTSHLGLPSSTNYPDHHTINSRRNSNSIPSGSSHNVINQQPHTSHPDSAIPSRYPILSHIQQQQHTDPLSSLPVLTHPSGACAIYPQHAASQLIQSIPSHQASSTDSNLGYSTYTDRRSRPPDLRLLSYEHNRNPNLHPHYHLMTKSHMQRVSVHASIDHRCSKSLMPLPETPAKTSAIGGSIKAGTPVYYCPPTIAEDGQEKSTSPAAHCRCTNQPMLLREISISADNIPALCLNDGPFIPSPLKEGCHMLAGAPGRRSFQRASMQSTKPKLKTEKEKSSSGESDDSNTSSRSNTPIKSSPSDDEGIDVQSHHSQELKLSSLHKHTKIPTDTTLTNKAPVDTAHQTLVDSAPKSSLGMESSHYDRSLDDEVKEIMQSAPARDIQKTAPSRSPLLGRKRNESTNPGYLLSNSNVMSDPQMRHSISTLSIGSSSQVSIHSRWDLIGQFGVGFYSSFLGK